MRSFRAFFIAILAVTALMIPDGAASRSWGINAGLFDIRSTKWRTGFSLSGRMLQQKGGHLEYGLEGAAELWRPVTGIPGRIVGAEWETSGTAYVFKLGPAVRLMTARPEGRGIRFFYHLGGGLAVVSSDVQILSYPVVPNPTASPVEVMGSQTAPYLDFGLGTISGDFFELALTSRVLFAEPSTAVTFGISLGWAH